MTPLESQLADRLALASEVLGIAALRKPPIGELRRLRERELEVREICRRFPCFLAFEIVKILEGS